MKACHWTKKAPVQNAVSGIIGCIFTPSLLQKESLWLRYTPICVTQQIRRSSTTVSSTWHPLPKTHTDTQRSCCSLCLQKTCHLAYWFILCCNKSAETGEETQSSSATHVTCSLLLNKKSTKMTPFTNNLYKISISHTGKGFVLLSRPVFFLLYICLFFWFMCDFVQYLTESCSEEAAHTAVRTLIDLGVSDSLYLWVCVSTSVCLSAEN